MVNWQESVRCKPLTSSTTKTEVDPLPDVKTAQGSL